MSFLKDGVDGVDVVKGNGGGGRVGGGEGREEEWAELGGMGCKKWGGVGWGGWLFVYVYRHTYSYLSKCIYTDTCIWGMLSTCWSLPLVLRGVAD